MENLTANGGLAGGANGGANGGAGLSALSASPVAQRPETAQSCGSELPTGAQDVRELAYICYEAALQGNLRTLARLQTAGAEVLLALKGFAFTPALADCFAALDGATASGVHEALLAAEFGARKISCFAPAFSPTDMAASAAVADELVLNSAAQYFAAAELREGDLTVAAEELIAREQLGAAHAAVVRERAQSLPELGLRCNLERSFSPREMYDPCGRFSRLGVRARDFAALLQRSDFAPAGLHFHALCEQDFAALEAVAQAFEANFLRPLYASGRRLRWINLGGGHHFTREGYDVAAACKLVQRLQSRYGARVIFEPGEAVGWRTGVLRAQVLDVLHNELPIAVLNASAEAHMPDTILMPYTSEVVGARIVAERDSLALAADLAGVSQKSRSMTSHGLSTRDFCSQPTSSARDSVANRPGSGAAGEELYINRNARARDGEQEQTDGKQKIEQPIAQPSRGQASGEKYTYILAANTCLAGDVMGVYEFPQPLKPGDFVDFADQIHYSVVKNTTFNGVALPVLVYVRADGSRIIRRFGYRHFRERN